MRIKYVFANSMNSSRLQFLLICSGFASHPQAPAAHIEITTKIKITTAPMVVERYSRLIIVTARNFLLSVTALPTVTSERSGT